MIGSVLKDFPGGSDGKASACNAGDPGSIPGSGRSPGKENGNPPQYSCSEIRWVEEPGGLQQAHRAAKSGTRLSNLAGNPELLVICQLLASALHYTSDI